MNVLGTRHLKMLKWDWEYSSISRASLSFNPLASKKPRVPSLALYKLGHSWLHSEFKASLGHMRPCLKEKERVEYKKKRRGREKEGRYTCFSHQ